MVSASAVKTKNIQPEELHLAVLPKATREAFLVVRSFSFFRSSSWYLAGGTALALQVGHRQSVDLDFFCEKSSFYETRLERSLMSYGGWTTTLKNDGTLYGILRGVKMSFVAYPFFRPSPVRMRCGNMRILLPDDIAAMKIIAISQRGRKRDFVDLYWYCNFLGSLPETIRRAVRQYPDSRHSVPHFLKSLVYFEDAEADPMPKNFFDADWKTIKVYFRREIPEIAKELLGVS